uniref:Scavenger receptor class B member 2 n=1 Tax=Macaca fascicularis TaxID=9541 RepID=G7P552_MACFA
MGRCCFYTAGTLSLLLLVTSVTLLVARVFQKAVDQSIEKKIVLRNGTEAFDSWEKPPLPVYTQFYFFNVTNPEEILRGETPRVEEVGPYTYRHCAQDSEARRKELVELRSHSTLDRWSYTAVQYKRGKNIRAITRRKGNGCLTNEKSTANTELQAVELRNKANVQFGDNGTTISAVSNKAYVFERDQSVGDPKIDLIRTLNIPVLTVIEWSQVHFLREIIEAMLKAYQQKLFVTHTVDELLWGYKDEILSLIHVFRPDISPYFGLFYEKNGTNDGDYVFLTGEDNYLNFTKIVEWNGKTSLDWWITDKCNMINGTDGDSFHPLITKDEVLYVFPSDFCRSVYITFSDYESVQGLPAFRYKVPAEILANTSDNAGFCIPEGNCLGSGVLNVSICKNGAPIIMSFPHFYQADERFVSAIEGMHPNKEDHETFVDINPLTGIILKAAKRFQINIYVKKLDDFVETGDIRTMVFPVMYLNESVLIDKETASRLKSVINTTLIITNIPYIIMALGVFFGLVFTWLACKGQGSMDEGTADERAPLIRT